MIDVRKQEVRSIEELIAALHPVQADAIRSEALEPAVAELRQMKNNISAVLSFTSGQIDEAAMRQSEFRHVVDEVRRECLLINGMISRILFRQRWLFTVSKIEDACEIITHYEELADAACRLCLMVAPELGNNLVSAF